MSSTKFSIHTSLLFDPTLMQFVADTSIEVDLTTGLITKVYKRTAALPESIAAPDIDLRGKTVLPGLVDAHTHIFLHSYQERSSTEQMRDESLVERVLRASNHCRAGLLAGYTTYRDLGTEGLRDADIGVRDAVNRGIIPGPRLFVATECIASSGSYIVHTENSLGGTVLPRISDSADGEDGVRAAVRRRIAAGADIVKFYGDYRRRPARFPAGVQFPPNNANPNNVMFTLAEMSALVKEAEAASCPVSAHCATKEAMMQAVRAGVLTIEHGQEADDHVLNAMAEHGTIFVPTLAVMELYLPASIFPGLLARTKQAWELGVRLACGGDTGAFAHGENVRELELHLQAGIPLEHVLKAATIGGWESCGGDRCGRKFGWWEEGVAADVVALNGDPRQDIKALRNVSFVMKDARVWKRDGEAVGMV